MANVSSCENRPFVLKPVSQSIFELSEELKHEFESNCRIRTHIDYIEEENVIVYEYLMCDLLSLVQNNPDLSIEARKSILREVGLGLKDVHAKDWIHLGMIQRGPKCPVHTLALTKPLSRHKA